MLIGYNYFDQHGYCYGVQNQLNYLQTKYSNVYYTLAEITEIYSLSELFSAYKTVEIIGLHTVTEIAALYTETLLTEE
jgi:hypothetical protein